MKGSKDSRLGSAFDLALDMAETLVTSVLIVVCFFTFIMRSAVVSGDSMEPTLSDGDRLLIRSFLYTPKCGDVVVVRSRVLGKRIVKRVIAVSGQKVVIDYENDAVYVCAKDSEPTDDDKLDEGYVALKDLKDPCDYFSEQHFDKEKNRYIYTVPVGYIFVLGDNRNVSTDSRAIGLIDLNDIDGKVFFRISSKSGRPVGRID